jgi:hypothetical protein
MPKTPDPWPFLTHQADFIENLQTEDAEKRYPLLGPSIPFQRMNAEENNPLSTMHQVVTEHMIQSGFSEQDYEIRKYLSYRGLPLSSKVKDESLKYIDQAIEFLYSKIQGLPDSDLSIIPVTRNGKYQSRKKDNIFVVDGFYGIFSLEVIMNEAVYANASAFGVREDTGGANLTKYDPKTHKPLIGNMILGASQFLIHTPFSEIIPHRMGEDFEDNYLELVGAGYDYTTAIETFSEGLSVVLAAELGVKLGIRNMHELTDETYALYDRRSKYQHVKTKSVPWIKTHGVQRAYDLWMQSPAEFMKAIGVEPETSQPPKELSKIPA